MDEHNTFAAPSAGRLNHDEVSGLIAKVVAHQYRSAVEVGLERCPYSERVDQIEEGASLPACSTRSRLPSLFGQRRSEVQESQQGFR